MGEKEFFVGINLQVNSEGEIFFKGGFVKDKGKAKKKYNKKKKKSKKIGSVDL